MATWITPKQDWDSDTYANTTDLNRIEGDTEYVQDLIATYDTPPVLDTIKTDWAISDYPYYSEMQRIEQNVKDIATQTATPIGWQVGTITQKMDYSDFNRIESNINALYTQTNNIINAFIRVGDPLVICGKGNTLF